MKINSVFKLIIAIVASGLAGIIGAMFTVSAIPNWYDGLVKPPLNPPAWVFGTVWTTLYALMGVSAFLIWRKGLILFCFGSQLSLWPLPFTEFQKRRRIFLCRTSFG